MPTLGAQQRAHTAGCSYDDAIPRPADKPCTAARHGTAAAYRRGCRCDLARRAIARYENERRLDAMHDRSRTLPNVGAVRRLHALRALGYSARDLASRIGVDERNIARWPHRTWISRAHHDAVCRVYTELAATPGPDERARRHAARRGWQPPLWWDDDALDIPGAVDDIQYLETGADVDEIAIDRYLDGDATVTLTRAEKQAALTRLLHDGLSLSAAGARVGINNTYARRYAAEAGIDVGVGRDHARTDHLEETG